MRIGLESVRVEVVVAWAGTALLGAWALSAGPIALRDFPLDDSWIHQVYVRGLLRDGLPTYNPGQPEAGFSSALWLFAAAPMHLAARAGVVPFALGAKLTSLACGALAAHKLARVARALGGTTTAAFATALLALASPGLCLSALSGMESSLALLCAAGALCALAERRAGLAGAWLAAAVLARPECATLAPVCAAFAWERGASPRELALRAARVFAPSAAAAGLWAAYCARVAGHPLPNTFYVKAAAPSLATNVRVFLRDVALGDTAPFALVAFALACVGLSLARSDEANGANEANEATKVPARTARVLVFAAAFAGTAAVALTRPLFAGVTFFQLRYFLPFAPLALPLAGLAVEALWKRAVRPAPRAAVALTGAAVAVVSLAPCRAISAGSSAEVYALHTRPALELAANAPPSEAVAAEAAGATAFFANRRVVDLYGLNLAAFAHAPDAPARGCVLAREAPSWVLVPDHFIPRVERPFALGPPRAYEVPRSFIIPSAGRRTVLLARASVRPALRARCGLPPLEPPAAPGP